MAAISLVIVDPTGSKKTDVEVPDDVPMRRLMPALVTKMSLPTSDEDGNIILYKLHRNKTGINLSDNDTIAGSGAEPNELFTLVPERVSSGPRTEWWQPKFVPAEKELVDAVEMSAPVYVPTRGSLAIGLVPSDLVYKLEESRSDEMRWSSIMWTLVGAVLGIVVNWATSDPIIISRASLIVFVILALMAVFIWIATRDYKKRADDAKGRIIEFHKPTKSSGKENKM